MIMLFVKEYLIGNVSSLNKFYSSLRLRSSGLLQHLDYRFKFLPLHN